MNSLVRFLLDADTLSPGAPGVEFGFEHPMPLWIWTGVFGVLVLLAMRSYWRMTGSRSMRIALAALRSLLLATLVTLIAGPTLIERQERTERDWAIVLLDRSESMTIPDAPGADGQRVSRDEQLQQGLKGGAGALRDVASHRELVWLGFDAGAYQIDNPLGADDATQQDAQSLSLPKPAGQRTRLGAALEQALRVAAARPLAGIIIASDGKSLDEPGASAIRQLRQAGAPVFVLPLGSETPLGDVSIRAAEGPGAAFVRDVAPVDVAIERTGPAVRVGAMVRLIDEKTGLTLDERRLDAAAEEGDRVDHVTLTTRPETPGDAQWRVVVEPDEPDLIAGNNTAQIALELVDRPIRSLYVDGYPRWEARYLKNLFLRESSITSTNLLLDPTRAYLQDSDKDLDRLPNSPEEWKPFDIVVLGDVKLGVFTREALEQLRDHVANDGAGLLVVGGPAATPNRWWDTPLADLLPFTRQSGDIQAHDDSVVLIPTEEAERLGVLRLGESLDEPWPEALADPATGWSQLRYAQRIRPSALKPAATPLALAAPVRAGRVDGASATPVVITMRYGAGRIIYVGTDEIWRWRYGRGETLPERFWLPLVRLLARESLLRSGRGARLVITPTRAEIDQPMQLRLELVDQSLIDLGLASVRVKIAPESPLATTKPIELTLHATQDGKAFIGQWLPTEGGRWRVAVLEAALSDLDLVERIRVEAPDDELRHPDTNHALLASLARETGGKVLEASDLPQLDELLPSRQLRFVNERREPLWDTPAALLAVLVLLTLEWVGRRAIRLI